MSALFQNAMCAGFNGGCTSTLQIVSPPAVKTSTAFVPMKPDAPVIRIFMLRRRGKKRVVRGETNVNEPAHAGNA